MAAIPNDLIEKLSNRFSWYGDNAKIALDTLGQVQESLSAAAGARSDGQRYGVEHASLATLFFTEASIHETHAANLLKLLEMLTK